MDDSDAALAVKYAEWAIASARRAGTIRREMQEGICFEIEMILHEAKEQETRDALVRLARFVLDPPRAR